MEGGRGLKGEKGGSGGRGGRELHSHNMEES